MALITIPTKDWTIALAEAIRNAKDNDIIVVHSGAMASMAHSAAKRLGKTVKIEIATNTK